MIRRPPRSTLFPYTRSSDLADARRPVLRRRDTDELRHHAERSAPDPVHRQHSRRRREGRQDPVLMAPPWASGVSAGVYAAGSRHVVYVPDNPLSHVLHVLRDEFPDVRTVLAT